MNGQHVNHSLPVTPEQQGAILAAVDASMNRPRRPGRQAQPGVLMTDAMRVWGTTHNSTMRMLAWLVEQGVLMRRHRGKRPRWLRDEVSIAHDQVDDGSRRAIMAHLQGRRETIGSLARALHLPAERIEATCLTLAAEGLLVGKRVGETWVFAHDITASTRVDPERATAVAASPEAQLREYLASLPPENADSMAAWRDRAMLPIKLAARKVGMRPGHVRSLVNERAVSHQGIGKHALVSVADLMDFKQNRMRPKRVTRNMKLRASRIAKEAMPEGDAVPASEAARRLGIRPAALLKWLERHDEAKKLCVRGRKCLMVPPKVLKMYAEASLPAGASFAEEVPEGWLNIWEAADVVGWSIHKLYKMLAKGEHLEAVYVKHALWFNPSKLAKARQALKAEMQVPDGWITLRAFASQLELDRSSISDWMRRRGFEMLKRRDDQRQVAVWLSPEAVAAYRAFRDETPNGVKVTPELRQAILADVPQLPPGRKKHSPGVIEEIAARHGISSSSLRVYMRQAAA